MQETAFNEKTLFSRKLDLHLRKKLGKYYIWSTALCGADNRAFRKNRSEIPSKFRNMVMQKDGKDQLE